MNLDDKKRTRVSAKTKAEHRRAAEDWLAMAYRIHGTKDTQTALMFTIAHAMLAGDQPSQLPQLFAGGTGITPMDTPN